MGLSDHLRAIEFTVRRKQIRPLDVSGRIDNNQLFLLVVMGGLEPPTYGL